MDRQTTKTTAGNAAVSKDKAQAQATAKQPDGATMPAAQHGGAEKGAPGRLLSLDALRGFDMVFIMGGAALLAALAQWLPCPFTHALAAQMDHVEWHGLRHHDTIFPLFLFIAGISFPFSLAKQRADGKSEGAIHWKVVRRGLTLVALGIIYNGLLSHWDLTQARYASVLGRIGLAWMFAALIYLHAGWRRRALYTAALLVGYWLLLRFVPAPDGGGADIYSAQGSLTGYIDRLLLPDEELVRIYRGTIRLGVDMSRLRDDWFQARGDTAIVRLPPIRQLNARFIDEARTQTFYESGTWSGRDRERLYRRARQRMLRRLRTSDAYRQAERNGREQVASLMRSFGFQTVIVSFGEQ